MVVDYAVVGTWLQNIVRFEIKFATCIHGNEQRVAFSMFEYIRTHFTLALTTFKVATVFTTMSPLKRRAYDIRKVGLPEKQIMECVTGV